MSPPLIAAALWALIANVIGMFPSKRGHWPAAYGLIALGLPILAWVIWWHGAILGAVVFLAAASVLRWPLRYLARWIGGQFGRAS